jgi:hypothetical protein
MSMAESRRSLEVKDIIVIADN